MAGDDLAAADRPALPDSGADTDAGAGSGGLIGLIELLQTEDQGTYHLTARAQLSDGPLLHYLSEQQFETVETVGACELRNLVTGYCEPACDGTQYCSPDDVCLPLPQHASAGDLVFSGLSQALTLVPDPFGYGEQNPTASTPFFAQGGAISVTAPGDVLPGFTVGATGVEVLEFDWEAQYTIHDDQDLQLTWTAASGDHVVEVVITPWMHFMSIALHIRCVAPDTGSLTIPWQLLQHIPYDNQCGGMMCAPDSSITRFSAGDVELGQGRVRLRVGSRRPIYTSRQP